MYIYQWTAGFSAARGDPLVVIQNTSCKAEGKHFENLIFFILALTLYCEIKIIKTDTGLDKIKSQSELIKRYSKCIQLAEDTIPADRKKRAYIFLAATAGMRLLE
jgi:hypothetical protein